VECSRAAEQLQLEHKRSAVKRDGQRVRELFRDTPRTSPAAVKKVQRKSFKTIVWLFITAKKKKNEKKQTKTKKNRFVNHIGGKCF